MLAGYEPIRIPGDLDRESLEGFRPTGVDTPILPTGFVSVYPQTFAVYEPHIRGRIRSRSPQGLALVFFNGCFTHADTCVVEPGLKLRIC